MVWQNKQVNVLKFSIMCSPQNGFFWGSVLPVFFLYSSFPPSLYLKRKGMELYSSVSLASCSIARVFLYWKHTTAACTKYAPANFKRWLWHHRTPWQGLWDLGMLGGWPLPSVLLWLSVLGNLLTSVHTLKLQSWLWVKYTEISLCK